IEARSGGQLTFALPTLYPTLLRLENRGWIKGRWVEKAGERQRCFYRLTPEGRRVLARQRENWRGYGAAVKPGRGHGGARPAGLRARAAEAAGSTRGARGANRKGTGVAAGGLLSRGSLARLNQ